MVMTKKAEKALARLKKEREASANMKTSREQETRTSPTDCSHDGAEPN